MVRGSTGDDQWDVLFAGDTAQVFAEVRGIGYRVDAVFRAEDTVQEVVGQRVGHRGRVICERERAV